MPTPTDLIDWLTVYRSGAESILGAKGILGQVSTARLNLDLSGVIAPYAMAPTVTKGPAMPPPDETPDPTTGLPKPTWGTVLGTCKKFDHPDKLLALAAAFQHLQGAMGQEIEYVNHAGERVKVLAGSALTAVL
jgi:hypothetical protein